MLSILQTNKQLLAATLFLFFCGPQMAFAGDSKDFGDYTVFYSAFTSDTLQPAMAKAYNITRSKNRGLLSISVVKKTLSPLGKPVKATVIAEATNLTGQLKSIEIREINENSSVYYISEFSVAHQEVLDITLKVTPEGESKPFTVKFRQQFYTQ